MKIFVESAGKSPEHDYNWIDEQLKIIEKPNIIKSFIGLLQQDSPSLLIGRKGEAFVLIVTGISSERRDYQNRIIRISVAWILKDDDDHVNEAKIRSLASKILLSKIFLSDTGEIKLKETIENSVPAGEENGFDVKFESLRSLLEKEPENCSPSKSLDKKLEINSKDTIKQLADELKERSLPEGDRPLVVVTGIQSRADFKKAKVWRGLANFVDERGGQKEEEINFRENIQGYKQSDDRHSKGGRKANEGSIQKRIVISVLAILFCVSLALGIWFYIQSNDQNPNNQQQNDNINSSNKPIQTLIMEPNAVQKELTSQEKTEELKEEKIN
ncbi:MULTISPECIES: hypothetical protein [Planktothrix]|uniref:Uncharacterized protein n=1 Tax=Planktothrix rubescens CCAP 1459/22 TaxID=329571 RepID=A0A6J7ZNM3_PLARU|nr:MULTISPECIES: hypothetical protein [Planktothrix]CAC5344443.1 conserved hypothetical protein [Planktothrix rubescens NIVA-CYA 18]CAD5917168.1 hypothetical protein PCC7821_00421 [Planktothrix rubescens NIVA-CYA 18]